jgi:hypothetical protein
MEGLRTTKISVMIAALGPVIVDYSRTLGRPNMKQVLTTQ